MTTESDKLRPFDIVRLKKSVVYKVPSGTIDAGTLGTVVEPYYDAKSGKSAIEVEFNDGRTLELVTVMGEDLELMKRPGEG